MPTSVIWCVIVLSIVGVMTRPLRLPEAVFALGGAAVLCLGGALSWPMAGQAVLKGMDVYLFLTGMMLVSEIARQTGVFEFVAEHAARRARGSAYRLLWLVYAVGVVVTALMSNDATAVVLTPAVLAATRASKVREPLPYLYACAFVANAASFVLPIANPANLVVFQNHMPPLGAWLVRFALPSLLSIGLTYGALRFTQRVALRNAFSDNAERPGRDSKRNRSQGVMAGNDASKPDTGARDASGQTLSVTGRWAVAGIAALVVVMLTASACDVELGAPTAACGCLVLAIVTLAARKRRPGGDADPFRVTDVLRGVSWGVLPLVARLFVLVEALAQTGVLHVAGTWLKQRVQDGSLSNQAVVAAGAGIVTSLLGNVVNNLPAGLVAGTVLGQAHAPTLIASAVAIGIDLGPNLSVTGSLATLLWLTALRREGLHVSAWSFLRVGAVVMIPALLAALAGLVLQDILVSVLTA
ncbi:arsenic transporter [Robbsia andropogonis]|uniref:arsenic transporter n=1 Tax=Robbsia andropogonis TaxID=28092 RepID=UPI003D24A969